MAKFIEGPCEYGESKGYKGSDPGVVNGEDAAPFSGHKRTGGSEVPEVTYDKLPGEKGDPGLATTDKLPKNLQ